MSQHSSTPINVFDIQESAFTIDDLMIVFNRNKKDCLLSICSIESMSENTIVVNGIDYLSLQLEALSFPTYYCLNDSHSWISPLQKDSKHWIDKENTVIVYDPEKPLLSINSIESITHKGISVDGIDYIALPLDCFRFPIYSRANCKGGWISPLRIMPNAWIDKEKNATTSAFFALHNTPAHRD